MIIIPRSVDVNVEIQELPTQHTFLDPCGMEFLFAGLMETSFVAHMEQVLNLYKNAYNKHIRVTGYYNSF